MPAVAEKDYYELLGVGRESSPDDIRKAYLKLAHKYHPDKTGGDKAAEEKLKKINEAYDTLKNPGKRKKYNAMFNGSRAGFQGGFGGPEWSANAGEDAGNSGFGDFFSSLFGGGGPVRARRNSRQHPGEDIETAITITLREAAEGTTRKIKIPRRETCADCNGSGAAPGSQPKQCPVCKGAGVVQRSVGAAFSMTQTCQRCGGTGTIVSKPCPKCHGNGWRQIERELSVRIPPGVDADARLRLAQEGEPGENGGPRGDLYVRILIAQDDLFRREGDDLICEVPVPFPVAALGGKVRVPTLTGTAELNIPEGAQNGTLLRMRGLGMPRGHGPGGKGDQIVRVIVEVPTQLTPEQRDLVRQLTPQPQAKNYPLYRRFLEKIRQNNDR